MEAIYEELRIAIHAVWLRRWLALAVAWGVCLAGWLLIALFPNSYESRARVLVQPQSLLAGKIGVTEADRQRNLDRVRQTLASTVALEKVVRTTDLANDARTPADIAAAVETLRRNIVVKAAPDNVIEISARSGAGGLSDGENARLAKAIATRLLDIFVEENLAGNRDEASSTLRFLDEELARREKGLQEAEAKRAEFEQRYMDLLPGVGSIAERMASARSELSQIETQLASAQAGLAALNGQLSATPASIAAPGGGGKGGQIAALEAQLADAAARGWTDRHPDVVAIRSQIARLRITGGGGGAAGGTPNPAYVTLRSMQAEKQGTAAALGARKAQIEADLAQFTANQTEEPGIAAEQARLSRDYEVLKAQYDKLLADREDVKLRGDATSKTDATSFKVIDPPGDPRIPVAPNRPLLLLGVLILGAGAGVGAAFAQSQLSTTFPTATRLARASGMPVLGSISTVIPPGERAERLQKLKWFAGGAAGLAGCFLILLLVEFVQRGMVA